MNGRDWLPGIQVLRGLMFLLVLVSHSGKFFPVDGMWGGAAVSVFFTLSGFLAGRGNPVAWNGMVTETLSGLFGKLVRFWPLHVVFLVVAAGVMGGTVSDFFRNLFFLQAWFGDARTALSFNWPSWFLSSLMACWLLSPFLKRLMPVGGRHAAVALLSCWVLQFVWATVWLHSARPYGSGYYWIYICPLARLVDYVAGMLIAKVSAGSRRRIPPRALPFVEISTVLVFALVVAFNRLVPQAYGYCLLWALPAACMVMVFAWGEGPLTRILDNRFFRWFGSRAFELYISHRMILRFYSDRGLTSWFHWVTAVLLVAGISELAARLRPERGLLKLLSRMKGEKHD